MTSFIKFMWNFRDYRKQMIANAEKHVRKNNKLVREGNYDDLTFFYFNGHMILDPTMNIESTRFVDPVAYYGDDFFRSPFVKKFRE